MQNARPLKEMNVKTVERSLMLLEILARDNQAQSLTRIAHTAKLSVSTTYRMLNTLCRNDFIEKDSHTGHYRLGLKAFIIGAAANRRIDIRTVAIPFLTKLMNAAQRPSCLATLSGQDVIYHDCIQTGNFLQVIIQTGFPVPLCQTASGMVLLANLASRERHETIQLLVEKRLIQDAADFSHQLNSVRAAGYVARRMDCAGICEFGAAVREISAPIYNHLGVCSAAVSIIDVNPLNASPDLEIELGNRVRQSGTEISHALGFGK